MKRFFLLFSVVFNLSDELGQKILKLTLLSSAVVNSIRLPVWSKVKIERTRHYVKMGRQIHTLVLKREKPGQKWGFGLTGGKDYALTFRVEKVALVSPAGVAGLKNLDYLVKVGGQEVFEKKHADVVKLIKECTGDSLELEIER